MSDSTAARPPATDLACTVRAAEHADVPAVTGALRALLAELGGDPPAPEPMDGVAHALIDDPLAGALLVAQDGDEIVGVLAASVQSALHVPGPYGLIQDLWVSPRWRGRSVGRALLAELLRLLGERDIRRVEVGLPTARFAGLPATQAFYESVGFAAVGPRMRLVLA